MVKILKYKLNLKTVSAWQTVSLIISTASISLMYLYETI